MQEVEELRTIQLKFWTYKFWISQNTSFNRYFTVDLSKYGNQDLLINDPEQLYKKTFFTKQGVCVVQLQKLEYLLVDLWTHEYIIFFYRMKKQKSENKANVEILTV